MSLSTVDALAVFYVFLAASSQQLQRTGKSPFFVSPHLQVLQNASLLIEGMNQIVKVPGLGMDCIPCTFHIVP